MQMVQPILKTVQPDLGVDDLRRSVDFYVTKLGFTAQGIFEQDGTPIHAEVSNGPVHFMFGPAAVGEGAFGQKLTSGGTRGAGVMFYISMDGGIDDYYQQVRVSGATIADPMTDQFWGDRTFTVEDPDGYLLTFAQRVKEFPPEMMDNFRPA